MPAEIDPLFVNIENARRLATLWVLGGEISFSPKTIWDEQIARSLKFLGTKEGRSLLNKFKLPVANRFVESLIRESILLSAEKRLETTHLQMAVVSALLCPIRQVIGSCFATAPAIFIQRMQPERLLTDLYDLLMTSSLQRTFEGKEFIVPMSPKWGKRPHDHPLLRVWEFTLASFSDYKTTFGQWNLYHSLGLGSKEDGGIGALIFSSLQEKLDAANEEAKTHHQEFLRSIDSVRASETLLRNADSEDRIRMRKGDLQFKTQQAYGNRERTERASARAEFLSKLYPYLIQTYTEKFQDHFIEVYDADVEKRSERLFEDSPAGFRLCYKHGRRDPSQWTWIQDAKEFTRSLRLFFLAIEPELSSGIEWEEGAIEISAVTTAILHHLESKTFLDFALRKKKPWSYTSGGSMHTLLKGYYCIEGELSEEKRSIVSPTDLLTFFLDLLKGLPYSVTKRFEEDPFHGLLAYSPTHAFLLTPGLSPFKEGWLDKGFTYTWIRDKVIQPGKEILTQISLDQAMQERIGKKVIQGFSSPRPYLSLPEFRSLLVHLAPEKEDGIDSLLFRAFPSNPPLLFADSNWADYFFAFAVNPATLELDLYRISSDGKRAYPMNPWRSYLNGSLDEPWGVLTRPDDLAGSPLSDIALKLKKA